MCLPAGGGRRSGFRTKSVSEGLRRGVARKRIEHEELQAGVPTAVSPKKPTEVAVTVVIGVDPHKATHTAVAIDASEEELVRKKVRAGPAQVEQLVSWAEPLGTRIWAIEPAGGLGYLLAQQLVAAGETVVDVPAALASRARVLSTGRSNNNDPNDALSVALSALRFSGLRTVEAVGHAEVLWLLTERGTDLGSQRCRALCRLHALAGELTPGGTAKEINASDVDGLLNLLRPTTAVDQVRYDLVVELVDDIRRLDSQLKVSHKRIGDAVKASGTSLTGLYGVGPIIAGMLIGCSEDIARFANRDSYASYNGTAPVEFSSGGRTVHRLSQRGNRQLNHALHMAAITQLRRDDTEGRIYFDRRVSEGKTNREAIRALKRQISNAAYRCLVTGSCRARM